MSTLAGRFQGGGTVDLGEQCSVSLSRDSEPGRDDIHYSLGWADGSDLVSADGPAASANHTFTAPGSYTVSASATDDDGTYGPKTTTITVRTPQVTVSGGGDVDEGSECSVGFSIEHIVSSILTGW